MFLICVLISCNFSLEPDEPTPVGVEELSNSSKISMAVDSTFDVTPVGLISARKEGYRLGSASSAQPDMVSAGITDKGRLRLTAGGSPGRATVRMNMKKGGKTISNALTVHTAEVSNASVESSCPQAKAYGGPVRYLAGSTVEFDYSMQGPDGKNLHGHGIYPLDIERGEAG
jgi:hypothetical protein